MFRPPQMLQGLEEEGSQHHASSSSVSAGPPAEVLFTSWSLFSGCLKSECVRTVKLRVCACAKAFETSPVFPCEWVGVCRAGSKLGKIQVQPSDPNYLGRL